MINTKDDDIKISNGFSKKSQNYLIKIRNMKGTNYVNLIIEESKSIIKDSSHEGFCFTKEQLYDIIQICYFEKIDIDYKITYSTYGTETIMDFITITKKDIEHKKSSQKSYKKKSKNCKLKPKNEKLQNTNTTNKNIFINEIPTDLSMDEIKQKILIDYGFIDEENVI